MAFHRIAAPILGTSLLLLSAATSAQDRSAPPVCPLSESQTKKAIDAFAEIAPTLNQEPRCVNCHGGVNPFIDDPPGNLSDPSVPRTKHGGGKQDEGSDCSVCHDNMLPKRDGSPSVWRLALPEHAFLGKDAPTLCKQMRDSFEKAEKFIGHLTDDNGNSNFTGTAFAGTRGLTNEGSYRPLHMTKERLVRLGHDWVDSMGGEFKGDSDCGCKPSHYVLRVTHITTINFGIIHSNRLMGPVDVPITFHDDGSYEGEATAYIEGNATVSVCSGETVGQMNIKVSGNAVEDADTQKMSVKIENGGKETGKASAVCPRVQRTVSLSGNTSNAAIDMQFLGQVGEAREQVIAAPSPGTEATVQAEIVKVE